MTPDLPFVLMTTEIMTYSLQYSDMNEEMRVEAMELCVTACEKFAANNEVFYVLTVMI